MTARPWLRAAEEVLQHNPDLEGARAATVVWPGRYCLPRHHVMNTRVEPS